MKVSIITITYNSAATVEQTIRTVLDQTYEDIEYIIIDGKSTDNTLEIVARYKDRIAKIISEKDKGLYDALNKGIANASGDIIGIIHSDDFYTNNNVIENVVRTFKENNADAVYANLYYVDKDNTKKIKRKWNSGKYTEGAFLNGWMPPHPTFFVKKEMYDKFGNYYTGFVSAADYEMMLRLIHKHKINVAYLDQYIVKMRIGGVSNVNVKNRFNANMEDRKAWEMNGLKPRFYTLTIKPLRKIIQFL